MKHRPRPQTQVPAKVLWSSRTPCQGSDLSGHPWDEGTSPGPGQDEGKGTRVSPAMEDQTLTMQACMSKDLFEADKKKQFILCSHLSPVEEAENRPVNGPSWRAARGGHPAAFHRTSRCCRSPAGSLQHRSGCPAMAALLPPCPRRCLQSRPMLSPAKPAVS